MKNSFLILILIIIPICSYGQDWTEKLNEDVVEVIDNSYQTTETQQITFENGNSIQIQFSAISPISVLSRDMFLSIFSSTSLSICVGIINEAGVSIDDVEMNDVENPNDSPDITIHFDMKKSGLTMDIGTATGIESETMTWAEFFKDN